MTRPTILITRAPNGFDWQAEGFHALHAPLLDIQQINGAKEQVAQALITLPQAIVMTSAQALAALPTPCPVPLAVVGAATAAHASAQGHTVRITAQGNVASLVVAITEQLDPAQGRLLYLRGEHISTDLAGILHGSGFEVEEIVTYRADAVSHLPDAVVSVLSAGQVQAASAYSLRSITILEQLLVQHGLEAASRAMPLVCFSPAIATRANAQMWQNVISAAAATDTDMLHLFKHLFAMPTHITTKA